MQTKVSTKGQIVVPRELRELDDIEPGQVFEIERLGRGEYRLVRRTQDAAGIVEWLRSCPSKGYFVPLDSESTDTL